MSSEGAAPRAGGASGNPRGWKLRDAFGRNRTRGPQAAAATAEPAAPTQRRWLRRHWILASVVTVVLVVAGGAGGWLYYLNSLIDNVHRVQLTLPNNTRPPVTTSKALNILIAGADNGPGPSIAADVAAGRWEPGQHRSDTIMILHIPADRSKAYLVSIPRDSYVKLYNGHGKYTYTDKINAAFSLYGPSGYLSTVEHLTGLRMSHLAIIDWQGFKDISTALGGVRICIPHTFYDDSQKITWHQGCQNLEGEQALQYVRTRHGLTNGDFDRIKRQQNFLRAMMGQLLSRGTLASPTKLTSTLGAITKNLTVSSDWSTSDIRNLAFSLRSMSTADVTFLTAPMKKYATTDSGASVVVLARKQSHALWQAISDDHIAGYLAKYGDKTLLGSPSSVR
ncbi:MAG: LCP family protein [Nocardioidaceae bacterium]